MFGAILRLVGGAVLAFVGMGFAEQDGLTELLQYPCFIGGAILALQGVAYFIGYFFARLKGSSGSRSSSGGGSSGGSRSGGSGGGSKSPDGHVERLIEDAINNRLPAGSGRLYCTVFSNYVSVHGSFTLCDSSDEGRVSDAISDGVNAGLQKAANEGYDVYDIDRVDADGVSLYADN